MTLDVYDVEVGHGGVTHGLPGLVLKLVQVCSLGEGVDGKHLQVQHAQSS